MKYYHATNSPFWNITAAKEGRAISELRDRYVARQVSMATQVSQAMSDMQVAIAPFARH